MRIAAFWLVSYVGLCIVGGYLGWPIMRPHGRMDWWETPEMVVYVIISAVATIAFAYFDRGHHE